MPLAIAGAGMCEDNEVMENPPFRATLFIGDQKLLALSAIYS